MGEALSFDLRGGAVREMLKTSIAQGACPQPEPSMNVLRHIQAVLWGFIGLGRRNDMSELHRSGNPIVLIATGVVLALLLVAVLVGLAILAVRVAA